MGLGVSGRAAVRYALHCGGEVLVSDSRPKEQFLTEEGEFLAASGVAWEAAGHSREFLTKADLLLISPGVNLELPLLRSLRDDGVQIVGELAVADGHIDVPVVAVTGTNGKTTVTTLIGEILKSAGKRVFVGGNIGTPLYEYLLYPGDYDIVVVEVSSFQLESAGGFAPDVGLLLNITPDHLDRHFSMERYARIKMNLFQHQQPEAIAIINGDDPLCRELPSGIRSAVRAFGTNDDHAAIIRDGRILLAVDNKTEEYRFEGMKQPNGITLMNFAATILAVRSLGCTHSQIQAGLEAFRSLPHRIEFVAEVNGVSYYNDSKATNTGAVVGALEQFPGNVILLAGGRDKGDDFGLLRDSVMSKVKKMVVLGEAAALLGAALADVVEMETVASMEDAVRAAARNALPGDVVLLSPACASFDMFSSYGHRGHEFKRAVLAMQNSSGPLKMGYAACEHKRD